MTYTLRDLSMPYVGAVIQNVSEMLRYGWADIRPILRQYGYYWYEFTSSNIGELFPLLDSGKIDALVIATNACNDELILKALREHRREFESYLTVHNGGLLMMFQKALTEKGNPEYGFLPESYELRSVNKPETHLEGQLAIPAPSVNHILLQYPNEIDIDQISYHCLHNQRLRALYRGFAIPKSPNTYITIVEDDNYDPRRPLLICSRLNNSGRVVSTGLILDWQANEALLQNCVTYVMKGVPQVALIEQASRPSFEFNYLAANLEINKVAYHNYRQTMLEFTDRMLALHRILVLDPSWTRSQIERSNIGKFKNHLLSGSKIQYFDELERTPVVSYAGGLREIDAVIENTIAWLQVQYSAGQWGRSFWRTFDVLYALQYLGKPVAQYWPEVLERITPHNVDGSYDEMFGATCALAQMYAWALGKASSEYKRTVEWLRRSLENQPLFFEQGTAIETFHQLDEDPGPDANRLYMTEAMARFNTSSNEFELSRYVKTLYACGYYDEAMKVALRLCTIQEPNGQWINVHETADVVVSLIALQRKVNGSVKAIEDAIFKGIILLKETYNAVGSNWQGDVAATAKALMAMVDFERHIQFPIDEVVMELTHGTQLARVITAVDASTRLNAALQDDILRVNAELRQVREASAVLSEQIKADRQKTGRLLAAVAAVSAALASFFVLVALFEISQGHFGTVIHQLAAMTKDWSAAVWAAIPLTPVAIVLAVLRQYGVFGGFSQDRDDSA